MDSRDRAAPIIALPWAEDIRCVGIRLSPGTGEGIHYSEALIAASGLLLSQTQHEFRKGIRFEWPADEVALNDIAADVL